MSHRPEEESPYYILDHMLLKVVVVFVVTFLIFYVILYLANHQNQTPMCKYRCYDKGWTGYSYRHKNSTCYCHNTFKTEKIDLGDK